ncbi:MAG: ROK family transcriptional regulator [Christensenellales bacterium]
MLDVKKNNRGYILSHIYRAGSMSRKALAKKLGLTPAAITLITNDLIHENLLLETSSTVSTNKKGRKEVLLQLNTGQLCVIGININKHQFSFMCMDLASNVIFEEGGTTRDLHRKSEWILRRVATAVTKNIRKHKLLENYTLIGVGVSVIGLVDPVRGISVDSYNVMENNVHIRDALEPIFGVPVLLTNNVCSLAHGENMLSGQTKHFNDMLFIRYSPGLGATRLLYENAFSVFDYKVIELGHMIVQPGGQPCMCGNQGCLETIIGYTAIQSNIRNLFNEHSAPYLYELIQGDIGNMDYFKIMQAYDAGDKLVIQVIDRVVAALALAVQNAVRMFDPQTVVFYGEIFDCKTFSNRLLEEIQAYVRAPKVVFSQYNMKLETFGPASTAISLFFENGGVLKTAAAS